MQKEKERYQEKLWAFISKKEIPKVCDMLEIRGGRTCRHVVAAICTL